MVVAGVYLYEHIEAARSVMALHNLGYLLQLIYHIVELRRILQVESDVSTRLIAELFRVDDELRAFKHAQIVEFLYALMYRSATHVAQTSHFQERDASVASYQL